MSKQLSFVVDDDTLELLEKLKKDLNAKTTAQLFRKAIALAELAVEQTKDENGKPRDSMATVTIRSRQDQPGMRETSIALRA
jgi:hypothetical protein